MYIKFHHSVEVIYCIQKNDGLSSSSSLASYTQRGTLASCLFLLYPWILYSLENKKVKNYFPGSAEHIFLESQFQTSKTS